MTEQTNNKINMAAADAVKVIARAAEEAASVVVEAANNSAKLLNMQTTHDHDLLIELKTRMESLRNDIKDIKDGTAAQIADHEKRLFAIEASKSKTTVTLSIAVAAITGLISMLLLHLFGIGL